MIRSLKTWYRRLPNPVRAALATTGFTFASLFAVSLIGWTGDVVEWADSSGASAFPSVSALGYAAVSAFGAAVSGLLNWVVRFTQERTGTGTPPVYRGELPQ